MCAEMKKTGELIRKERIRRGIKQGELGAKVGVDKAQISRIERGLSFTAKTVVKILEELNLSDAARLINPETPTKVS